MIVTTEEQKKNLRIAGAILAGVLSDLAGLTKEGGNAAELDLAAEHAMRERGAVPAFLGYRPQGARSPYPSTLCVAVNDEVVHGLPTQDKMFRRGDVVTLDAGLSYNGYFVDAARTIIIGEGDSSAQKLVAATKEALDTAIATAKAGAHTGDIGAAIARVAKKYQLGVVKDLGGHGVGASVHEKPYIDNEGKEGEGDEILEGMVLAIEPMLCEGKGDIILKEDDWTYAMLDRKRAAHWEATVIVGQGAPEVVTPY